MNAYIENFNEASKKQLGIYLWSNMKSQVSQSAMELSVTQQVTGRRGALWWSLEDGELLFCKNNLL